MRYVNPQPEYLLVPSVDAKALDLAFQIIGDALVALTFSRNTLSTIFVFALTPWIAGVGFANVFNTIGAIGFADLLFSVVLIWKGKEWRFLNARRYKHYAARQFDPRPIENY